MFPPWSKRGSATGQSFVIPESALPRTSDAITRIDYAWSGDVLVTLLSYLDEQGIDLRTRDGSVFVFTSEQRERYAARLDPSAFDGADLRRYYEELNETAADGVEYAMLDGIAFFRDSLEPLEPALVAVLVIG
jgi:hypothetical protein